MNVSELSILNENILEFINKYSIFNGKHKDLTTYIFSNDKQDFQDCIQFILFCDSKKNIFFFKKIEVTQEESFWSKCFFFKKKETSETKFQILKKEYFNTSKFDKDINLILLEIPKKNNKEILEFHTILKNWKFEKNETAGFLSIKTFQFLSVIYIALALSVYYKVLYILPFNLIVESEIILVLKLTLGILISLFLIAAFMYGIIFFLALYPDLKIMKFRIKYIILPIVKFFFFVYLGLTAFINIWASINIFHNERNLLSSFNWIFPLYKVTALDYLRDKTRLVYDNGQSQPILYLGIKDNVYYYYDTFDACRLRNKVKDKNSTQDQFNEIKNLLLNSDQDSDKDYKLNGWKVKRSLDMSFDYNNTLIVQSILKCVE